MKAKIFKLVWIALSGVIAFLGPKNSSLAAESNACLPPPTGLVSWWRGESNALDSADGNNGMLVGDMAYASGRVGESFNFTNANSYVKVPASSNLNVGLSNGFTIECWINPLDVSIERPLVEWNRGTGSSGAEMYGVHLWISTPAAGASSGCLFANIFDTNHTSHYFSSASDLVNPNMFQHVALTYEKTSGIALLYLNGAEVARTNFGTFTPQTSYDLYLGWRPGPYPIRPFAGLLDEVSIYNRALSSNEIGAIYLSGDAGKCAPNSCLSPPTGLVSWWRGEATPWDSAGTNNGILQGDISFAPGEVCRGFLFNGIDAGIKIPAASNLNLGAANGFTIETWINPADVNRWGPLIEWNNGSFGSHLMIADHYGGGTLYANLVDLDGNSHSFYSATNVIVANVFQHVALTFEKATGQVILYRNGNIVASQVLGEMTPQTTYDLYLGHRPASDEPYWFHGIMDEVSLYNRALNSNEIWAIYDAGSAGKCHPIDPPIVICPPDIVTNVSPGKCDAIVSFEASAFEPCAGTASVLCIPPSGSHFPKGTTMVNCMARGAEGVTNYCSFHISVIPPLPGPIICSPPLTNPCPGSLALTTRVDNLTCDLLTVVSQIDGVPVQTNTVAANINRTAFEVYHFFNGGIHRVQVLAFNNGVTNSCETTVSVEDVVAPQMTCPANILTNILSPDPVPVYFDVRATDNCSAAANIVCLPPPGSSFLPGTNAVTCVATDTAGNSNSCSFLVTVIAPLSVAPLVSQTVCAGETARFGTVASGAGPFTYTWTVDGQPAGMNAPEIEVNTTPLSHGDHTVRVSVANPFTEASSETLLRVGSLISATPLTNLTCCACETATLSTTVTGDGPVQYVWRANGRILPSETNQSLAFPNIKSNEAGIYSVEIIGFCNTVTQSATLTLLGTGYSNPATFANTNLILISDLSTARPYPSEIPVTCLPGPITNMTVSVFGLSHSYAGDIDMLLVSPSGEKLRLMSDVGSRAALVTNLNLTFDDAAADYLPSNSVLVAGTFKPTNYDPATEPLDSFPLPAPEGPFLPALSDFKGLNASGTWSLYVLDDSQADQGWIARGWRLTIGWDASVPRILSSTLRSDGRLEMLINSLPQSPHVIEASQDLEHWVPVGSYTAGATTYPFVDNDSPPFAHRFYRVLRCP